MGGSSDEEAAVTMLSQLLPRISAPSLHSLSLLHFPFDEDEGTSQLPDALLTRHVDDLQILEIALPYANTALKTFLCLHPPRLHTLKIRRHRTQTKIRKDLTEAMRGSPSLVRHHFASIDVSASALINLVSERLGSAMPITSIALPETTSFTLVRELELMGVSVTEEVVRDAA